MLGRSLAPPGRGGARQGIWVALEICAGHSYTIVVRFPWGERREARLRALTREADGTLRWSCGAELGVEPYLDSVLQEAENWVLGWVGGSCDVTAVVSLTGAEAPEP